MKHRSRRAWERFYLAAYRAPEGITSGDDGDRYKVKCAAQRAAFCADVLLEEWTKRWMSGDGEEPLA